MRSVVNDTAPPPDAVCASSAAPMAAERGLPSTGSDRGPGATSDRPPTPSTVPHPPAAAHPPPPRAAGRTGRPLRPKPARHIGQPALAPLLRGHRLVEHDRHGRV